MADVITANELRIVDGEGRVRIVLGLIDGDPSIQLADKDGKTRAHLCLLSNDLFGDEEPALLFKDKNGRARAAFCISRQNNQPLIELRSEYPDAETGITIGLNRDGNSVIHARDADGVLVFSIPSDDDEETGDEDDEEPPSS